MDLYGHYCGPVLVRLLQSLGLDATYERSKGDFLWRREGMRLTRILDLVGGYGVNLFGHCHPEIVAYAQQLLDNEVTGFAQCSIRAGAGQLAHTLAARMGPYAVVFTNSGSETVEAALKHAHLERGRSLFWAVQGAFHGKTIGASQLTSSYYEPFTTLGPRVRFLNPHDPTDWEDSQKQAQDVAAAFIEPIQGEGGVRPLPVSFIEWLRATCSQNEIPIVSDEIQTGMGRTGAFLASERFGLDPDYICLGKALGGGIAKIGALLIKHDRFVPQFSMIHSSTFAEDDWSCLIALKALEILERDKLPERCAEAGDYLLARLEALRECFPGQIREIRGEGLMVGIELRPLMDSPSASLQMLSQHEYLGYFAAAYLLNSHHIRVLPTLSNPLTIRVEPSAYIERSDLDRFVEALTSYCQAGQAADLAHLIRHQTGLPSGPIVDYSHIEPLKREEPHTPQRVAFIGHLIDANDSVAYDRSLEQFSSSQLETFFDKGARVLEPTILHGETIRSATGEQVHLSFIGLSITTQQIVKAWRNGKWAWIMSKIEAAATLAKEAGCQVLGLGGHTSILTGNCQRLKVEGIAMTSGNSLTLGMGIRALRQAAHLSGINLGEARLGVIGATGNIASTYAIMMAPEVNEMVLVVRDPASARVARLVDQIRHAAPDTRLEISDSLTAVRGCSLIATASNSGGSLIQPEHLSSERVVICDIATPPDVSPSVRANRPDVIVLQGGIVRLPFNHSFSIPGISLEPGQVFACLAETLLMGLEGMRSHGSYGAVNAEGVAKALAMADKHGFVLGAPQFSPAHELERVS